jgi:hypothetical protein
MITYALSLLHSGMLYWFCLIHIQMSSQSHANMQALSQSAYETRRFDCSHNYIDIKRRYESLTVEKQKCFIGVLALKLTT